MLRTVVHDSLLHSRGILQNTVDMLNVLDMLSSSSDVCVCGDS